MRGMLAVFMSTGIWLPNGEALQKTEAFLSSNIPQILSVE